MYQHCALVAGSDLRFRSLFDAYIPLVAACRGSPYAEKSFTEAVPYLSGDTLVWRQSVRNS